MKLERKKSEVIKKINLILKSIIDDPKIILTVLDVNLPAKKGNMTIYLSIFPDDKKEMVVRNLIKETNKIKLSLKKFKVLKYLPKKIFFRYDPSLRFMQDLDKIFK